jgi:hypothetical protein
MEAEPVSETLCAFNKEMKENIQEHASLMTHL